MNIIDLHCDVLYKLWEGKGEISFKNSEKLDANKIRLQSGGVKVQAFAIFLQPELKVEERFQVALAQIDYFYKEILEKNSCIRLIKDWNMLLELEEEEIGAILTLEGVDCIGNDLQKLRILYYLGVLSVGLTWNHANLAADGVGETRGAGLTDFGKNIVQLNNEYKRLTDVSHLSERAFWDVIELAKYPIASHSNSKTICNHPRNLTDEQAKALFAQGGMVHVVYHPGFTKNEGKATIADLIKHIDHFCSLGGINQIGLGSDFDGIDEKINGLGDASKHQNLINELLKYYSEDEVKGFASKNFLRYAERIAKQ